VGIFMPGLAQPVKPTLRATARAKAGVAVADTRREESSIEAMKMLTILA
jgi:hypothetical protein